MFTDMVGFSQLSEQNEKKALDLLEEHRKLLRTEFEKFNGNEIKTSINVKPWPKCCLLLFNIALANKHRLLGLFVDHCNGKSQ